MQDLVARVKLGVTDHWLPKDVRQMSSSGAKLYVQTKPQWSLPALRMMCSVMEEADVEIPPNGWFAPRFRKSVKPPTANHKRRALTPQLFCMVHVPAIGGQRTMQTHTCTIMHTCVTARRRWLAVGDLASA